MSGTSNAFVDHLRSELAENKHGLVIVDTEPGRGAVTASKEALGPKAIDIEVVEEIAIHGLVGFSAKLKSASAQGLPVVIALAPSVSESDRSVVLADVKGFVEGGGRAILVTYDSLIGAAPEAIKHSAYFEEKPAFGQKLSASIHARRIAEMRRPAAGSQPTP